MSAKFIRLKCRTDGNTGGDKERLINIERIISTVEDDGSIRIWMDDGTSGGWHLRADMSLDEFEELLAPRTSIGDTRILRGLREREKKA